MDTLFYVIDIGISLIPVALWFFFGRDPQIKEGPVTAWYDAPKHPDGKHFSPAETGLLFHESITSKELIATLVELIRKGFLIFQEEKQILIFDVMKERTELSDEEQQLIHSIFQGSDTVILSNVDWQLVMKKYRTYIIDRLIAYGYFFHNPYLIQAGFTFVFYLTARILDLTFLYFTMIFAFFMSKRTERGRKQYVVLVSFRRFLNSQKHHWQYQAEQNITENKFLPYAIALLGESTWEKRFYAIDRDLAKRDRHTTVHDLIEPVTTAVKSLFKK